MCELSAAQAMSALNGRDQDGRALKVNEAKPQEPRAVNDSVLKELFGAYGNVESDGM
jgi:hypothetical protein